MSRVSTLSTGAIRGGHDGEFAWPSSRISEAEAPAPIAAIKKPSPSVNWLSAGNRAGGGPGGRGGSASFPDSRLDVPRATGYPYGADFGGSVSFPDSRLDVPRATGYPYGADFDGSFDIVLGLDVASSRAKLPRVTAYPQELMPRGGAPVGVPDVQELELKRWLADVTEDVWPSSRLVALSRTQHATRPRTEDYPVELVEEEPLERV